MKKAVVVHVFFHLAVIIAIGQDIELKDNIAYVDGISYLEFEKNKGSTYIIKDIETHDKLLKIELVKAYNRIDEKTHRLPQVYSYRSKRLSKYEINIQSEVELIKFIFSKRLVPLKKYKRD